MAGTKHNLTITLDADLVKEARIYAAHNGTSVNQLVREYLEELVMQEKQHQEAIDQLEELMSRGIGGVGDITWKREDLYRSFE